MRPQVLVCKISHPEQFAFYPSTDSASNDFRLIYGADRLTGGLVSRWRAARHGVALGNNPLHVFLPQHSPWQAVVLWVSNDSIAWKNMPFLILDPKVQPQAEKFSVYLAGEFSGPELNLAVEHIVSLGHEARIVTNIDELVKTDGVSA